MSTIKFMKIGTVNSVAPGGTSSFQWNNPPWDTVLSFFAYPLPTPPVGPHGGSTGSMQVTRVTSTWFQSHQVPGQKHVTIEVTNTGGEAAGYDLYMSWVVS
jgi:hypothetical protein